jgi:hypothetical protein
LGLPDGINLRPASGNDKQSLKQPQLSYPAHARRRGIQYAAAAVIDGGAGVYWIIRLSRMMT